MIVLPGFVDSHLHAWAGQLRGLAPAVDLETYIGRTHGGAAPHYRPHDMYVGNLITSLQCLDAGVTTILDNSHNTRTADHSNAAVEALFDAGIRAVHASGAPIASTWDQHWPGDVLRLTSGVRHRARRRLVGHDLAKLQGTVESSRDYLLAAQGLTSDPFADRGSKPIRG